MNKRLFDNIGETLYSEVLENGLGIHVVPKPGFKKSYAFFATNYGGADRRFRLGDRVINTPAGVAHFLEHKMFDTPDGGNALNVLSANGASPNAYTSSSMTAYFFESTEGFYENLETLLSFVSVPYFTKESVQKEQGIIGQEIRMVEDNPGNAVYYNLMKCLFAENPVRDSVAGTIESIGEITHETLYDCHKVFYNPSNMVLCVVGDADPLRIADTARRLLPKAPGELPFRDYGKDEGLLPFSSSVRTEMEVSAPLFIIGSKFAPNRENRLRQELIAELSLDCLLGESSLFYTDLYKEGILNNMFGYEADYSAGAGMLFIEGESQKPERVLEQLKQEVIKVSEKGLLAEEFERQKKAVFGRHLRGLGRFENVCRMLAEGHFAGCCRLDAFKELETITMSEVCEYIEQSLSPQRLAMSVVSPKR